MASQQNPHNPSSFSSGQVPGQPQMRRSTDLVDQPSDAHNQHNDSTFLQETGTQMRSIAQGAAQGAVNMAKGAAVGAANLAHGAADAVKNTLGMNPNDSPNSPNDPNWPNNTNRASGTNNPPNYPTNTRI